MGFHVFFNPDLFGLKLSLKELQGSFNGLVGIKAADMAVAFKKAGKPGDGRGHLVNRLVHLPAGLPLTLLRIFLKTFFQNIQFECQCCQRLAPLVGDVADQLTDRGQFGILDGGFQQGVHLTENQASGDKPGERCGNGNNADKQ